MVRAVAEAMFEPLGGSAQTGVLVEEVLAFVAAASLVSRVTLRAALGVLRLAPLLLFVSLRPLERLDRARRREVLARVERSPLRLALVAWRTLLILHFYEDARELAQIGYRDERRRHLAVIPAPAESGVRLREDVGRADDDDAIAEEKGAA